MRASYQDLSSLRIGKLHVKTILYTKPKKDYSKTRVVSPNDKSFKSIKPSDRPKKPTLHLKF